MKTKKCIGCGIEKELVAYHCQPKATDGHVGRCKACTKLKYLKRYAVLRKDPVWIEKERKRSREKYKRLGYKDSYKRSYKKLKQRRLRYMETYPEKYAAKNKSRGLKIKPGYDKHHWSYQEIHATDIIYIKYSDHIKLHRFIVYDQERKMYRRCDTMELLDTKAKHLKYFNKIKNKP